MQECQQPLLHAGNAAFPVGSGCGKVMVPSAAFPVGSGCGEVMVAQLQVTISTATHSFPTRPHGAHTYTMCRLSPGSGAQLDRVSYRQPINFMLHVCVHMHYACTLCVYMYV